MRSILLLISIVVAIGASAQEFWTGDRFSDLFTVRMIGDEGDQYLSFDPDSMLADPNLSARCTALWPALMYLHSMHSDAYGLQFKLEEWIPDIERIRNELNASLDRDTAFQKIYLAAINRSIVPPIHVDSLMKIVSRFFYVHRSEGKVVQHVCVGINEVLELPQTQHTPFYNAFAYQAVHRLDDPFGFIREAVGDDVEELRRPITDERLRYFTERVYSFLEKNDELRDHVIKEYEATKEHLNFQMIY